MHMYNHILFILHYFPQYMYISYVDSFPLYQTTTASPRDQTHAREATGLEVIDPHLTNLPESRQLKSVTKLLVTSFTLSIFKMKSSQFTSLFVLVLSATNTVKVIWRFFFPATGGRGPSCTHMNIWYMNIKSDNTNVYKPVSLEEVALFFHVFDPATTSHPELDL